jgi:hypothetical protein
VFAAGGDRGQDIVGVARDDDTDRNLAVVGGIGRVKGAAAGIESHLASNLAAQGGLKI